MSVTKDSFQQTSLMCLQCYESYDFPQFKDDYLAHLFLQHRLVIADIDDIEDLKCYLSYWSNQFKNGHELQECCTTILLDQLPDGTPSKCEKYYLLSDIVPQDYELRKSLYSKRLEEVLQQHQFERSDRTFSCECIYCHDVIKGLRSEYVEHLFNKHYLQLGKPQNLVFIDDLVECIKNKLNNLTCIFCEKIFKDRSTLKEHMRKKGHKRINPDIRFYDKFYLENYKTEKSKYVKNVKNDIGLKVEHLSLTKSKPKQGIRHENIQKSTLTNNGDENDSDWSDWDGEQVQIECFFCKTNDTDFINLKTHMLITHNFDFEKTTRSLTFYQKIKIVNYIRRQIQILHCINCNKHFKTLRELIDHMNEMKHYDVLDKKQWNRPEYFFSTIEDDGMLYLFDEINVKNNGYDDNQEKQSDDETSVVIISEDLKLSVNKEAEVLSMENFKI